MNNILCFDVESNGLHGFAFAVAGIVLSPDGDVLSRIALRASDVGPLDPWVVEHVIPAMETMHPNCSSRWAMRQRFWRWFDQAKGTGLVKDNALVVVDCGWPVEVNFLSECVNDDRAREMNGPYPLHELSTLLLAIGRNPLGTHAGWLGDEVKRIEGVPHDPRYDAELSAREALKALRILDGRNALWVT